MTMTTALPDPDLRLPSVEYVDRLTNPETRRVEPLMEPVIRLRLFTPAGSARYAHMTEDDLLALIMSATTALRQAQAARR